MDEKYAVLRIKGKQYLVREKDEILVDKLTEKEPQIETLLVSDSGNVTMGKPIVEKAKIKVKVLKPIEKGEKITVVKYKAKSRYRKQTGFRPQFTRLLIESISI